MLWRTNVIFWYVMPPLPSGYKRKERGPASRSWVRKRLRKLAKRMGCTPPDAFFQARLFPLQGAEAWADEEWAAFVERNRSELRRKEKEFQVAHEQRMHVPPTAPPYGSLPHRRKCGVNSFSRA